MDHVSRPLIGLLVAVVAFFALWLVALKPSSGNSAGTPASGPSLGALQSAVTKAHQAVTTANSASARAGGTVATTATPTGSAASGATSTAGRPARPSTGSGQVTLGAAGRHRLGVVESALKANKVLTLLFYNPSAADDQAVKQELASVPQHGGRVVSLAVPIAELSRYSVVTDQVAVGVSPTLVVIDPDQQAQSIVGFADRFEIAQRVSDALRVP